MERGGYQNSAKHHALATLVRGVGIAPCVYDSCLCHACPVSRWDGMLVIDTVGRTDGGSGCSSWSPFGRSVDCSPTTQI